MRCRGERGRAWLRRYKGHYIHAHNYLSDLRNLAKARFAARNSALVRAISHHCPGSYFSTGQVCQGTATAYLIKIGRAQVIHQAIGLSPKVLNSGLGKTGRVPDTAYAKAVDGLVVPNTTSDQMLYQGTLSEENKSSECLAPDLFKIIH